MPPAFSEFVGEPSADDLHVVFRPDESNGKEAAGRGRRDQCHVVMLNTHNFLRRINAHSNQALRSRLPKPDSRNWVIADQLLPIHQPTPSKGRTAQLATRR